MSLYGRAIGWTPRALRRYRKEIARLLAEVSFGAGALIVILGTAGVMAALHQAALDILGFAGRIDWSRASIDAMHVRAVKGGT